MKQQITSEQLNELSTISLNLLHKWQKNKGYIKETKLSIYFPELTIGQMIEFLDADKTDQMWTIAKDSGNPKGYVDWTIYPLIQNKETLKLTRIHNEELCDALWEAVKVKLSV